LLPQHSPLAIHVIRQRVRRDGMEPGSQFVDFGFQSGVGVDRNEQGDRLGGEQGSEDPWPWTTNR
jgi:hypothetical protein